MPAVLETRPPPSAWSTSAPSPPRRSPGAWGYRPALDGLRSVAIVLVVLFHAGVAAWGGGFIGVDTFFVLSGYLMGSVVIAEFASTGTVRLRRFYARRVRRLLPAAVVTVVAVSLMAVVVESPLRRTAFVGDARGALLYVANWHFLGGATDYFADELETSPFLHFWSLAIEEQFYLGFPVVMLVAMVACRRLRRRWPLSILLGAGAAVSLALQVRTARHDELAAYYGTFTRLYQLLAGAFAAAVLSQLPALSARAQRHLRPVGLATAAALGGIVVAATDLIDLSASSRGILATGLAVVAIVGLELARQAPAARVLAVGPLVYLGRISYGIYLWHWPLIVLARPLLTLTPVQTAILGGAGGAAIAALSFQLVEQPIRQAPALARRPVPVIAAGLSLSIVGALVVVPNVLDNPRQPSYTRRGDPTALVEDAEVSSLLAAAPPALQRLDPGDYRFSRAECSSSHPEGCIVHEGGGPLRVNVIGDSNAAVLVGTLRQLAEEHDFTLSATTWPGCPWQLGVTWQSEGQSTLDACIARRRGWYRSIIPALDPDLIIAVNVPRDLGSTARRWADMRGNLGVDLGAATEHSLERLLDGDRTIALLEPLPYPSFDPNECLSSALTVGECSYRAAEVPGTEGIYRRAAERHHHVFSIDYDRAACPYLPICIPVVDGYQVFDDERHLDNGWLLSKRNEIWDSIVTSGALDGHDVDAADAG